LIDELNSSIQLLQLNASGCRSLSVTLMRSGHFPLDISPRSIPPPEKCPTLHEILTFETKTFTSRDRNKTEMRPSATNNVLRPRLHHVSSTHTSANAACIQCIDVKLHHQTLHSRRRSTVVERWSRPANFPSCASLLLGRIITLWVRRPLSVSQHGQLSHPSLRGR